MEISEVLLPLLVAMVTASWGTTQARLIRIEREQTAMRAELATKPSRDEFDSFRVEVRAELATKPGREEFDSFRAEMRADMTALRTDMTQIALAVGAGRPQASEG